IAKGGMGEVYEAQDEVLEQSVALKTIRVRDEKSSERFKREIAFARRVTHANLCRIFDVGFHRESAFLTMGLLRGETLTQRLAQVGSMKLAEAKPLIAQMAAALEAAHQAGVVHRDFKSSNVVLVGERAVVTDFGLARSTDASDSTDS